MFDNKLEQKRKINFFINKIYHLIFSEKFSKKIKFNFDKKSRLDLINYVIEKNKYNKYLEIGCHNNEVFDQIRIKKIGVDPISGGNFRGTSDYFFSENSKKFDCIFIDGLHEYNQVSEDIKNSLNVLNDNGIILLHDCLPTTLHKQAVPRYKNIWNGDVWKCIVYYRTLKNIDIVTCKIDQGISAVRKIKNKDFLDLNVKNFKELKFRDFYYNYPKYMRILEYKDFLEYIKN